MNELIFPNSPADQGFYFPAEWYPHRATWLSWPHKEASWPGKMNRIFTPYATFIKYLAKGEKVCINVTDENMKQFALTILQDQAVNLDNIEFYFIPTNDAWCRDHGPSFLIKGKENEPETSSKAIVSWLYNAWGNKYPPFDLDIKVPQKIAEALKLPVFYPGIVMEGGSVDFNGKGTVLTTTACLLNANRNPHLTKLQVENYLYNYYGASQVLWLDYGIVGDDTDGHIDDITRFVSLNHIITMVERNPMDENYEPLKANLQKLKSMRLLNGSRLEITEIQMPSPQFYDGIRLPASYANFYIANSTVIVPIFNDVQDHQALEILASVFPTKEVVGIDSSDIIWGLGSFHCLSQQEPVQEYS